MAKKVVSPKSVGELFEDLSILKLKIALLEKEEEDLDQRDLRCNEDKQLECIATQGEQRILKHISRSYRKNQIKRITRTTLPQLVRIAACILLFCYIGLTVVIAANSSARIRIMKYIINFEEEYTEFGFEDTGEYMDVPGGWEGYYFPAYIPSGFNILHTSPTNVTFINRDGILFEFDDMSEGTKGTLDTEGASIELITINGHSAVLVEKGQWISILWNVDNRILLVGYTGGRSEAIHIAENVRMLK